MYYIRIRPPNWITIHGVYYQTTLTENPTLLKKLDENCDDNDVNPFWVQEDKVIMVSTDKPCIFALVSSYDDGKSIFPHSLHLDTNPSLVIEKREQSSFKTRPGVSYLGLELARYDLAKQLKQSVKDDLL
tara:strand:+ start:433 stop:822 length:390 start_codon:yes stop_codon:yes gene_type:complete